MQGEDKGLAALNSKPLIAHVINALQNHVDDFVISANRNIEVYKQFSSNVIPDNLDNNGPLSGIAAALPTCKHDYVLVTACDMPFLHGELIERLSTHLSQHDICIAKCNDRFQLFLLMKKSLVASVSASLANGNYKLMQWVEAQSTAVVDFNDAIDAFQNINSGHDLDQAQSS